MKVNIFEPHIYYKTDLLRQNVPSLHFGELEILTVLTTSLFPLYANFVLHQTEVGRSHYQESLLIRSRQV